MNDPWALVGWLCVVILVAFLLLYLALGILVVCVVTRARWKQRIGRRKTQRANQGRVQCEWKHASLTPIDGKPRCCDWRSWTEHTADARGKLSD